LPRAWLPAAAGQALCDRYAAYLRVEFPSPATGDAWRIVTFGWVGAISLTSGLTIMIEPKVPVARVFDLLDAADGAAPLALPAGITNAATIRAAWGSLAAQLCDAVAALMRRGLAQRYRLARAPRPVLRGRLDIAAHMRHGDPATVVCVAPELGPGTLENAILAWTLADLGSAPTLAPATRRRAQSLLTQLRAAHGAAPNRPAAWPRLAYDRQTARYRLAHALCRLFWLASTPQPQLGDTASPPWLVHMPSVFEAAVARWLLRHAPGHVRLHTQRRVSLGADTALTFTPDIMIVDRAGDRAHVVLDTKYTADAAPTAEAVAQVVAYATAVGATQAWLIYPRPVTTPLVAQVGAIMVRAATFDLGLPVDDAGRKLLAALALEG
jgi:5-methylcytosine-specific restriction enzyme subunit McrC